MVAPVVVKPEKDSKKASAKDRLGSSNNNNGMAEKLASTVQKRTTIKKPSRGLKSPLCSRLGYQERIPTTKQNINAIKNDKPPPSRYNREINAGGSIVTLRIATNNPRIRIIFLYCTFIVDIFL